MWLRASPHPPLSSPLSRDSGLPPHQLRCVFALQRSSTACSRVPVAVLPGLGKGIPWFTTPTSPSLRMGSWSGQRYGTRLHDPGGSRGGLNGQAAVSALGSGRTCPTATFTACCPRSRFQCTRGPTCLYRQIRDWTPARLMRQIPACRPIRVGGPPQCCRAGDDRALALGVSRGSPLRLPTRARHSWLH